MTSVLLIAWQAAHFDLHHCMRIWFINRTTHHVVKSSRKREFPRIFIESTYVQDRVSEGSSSSGLVFHCSLLVPRDSPGSDIFRGCWTDCRAVLECERKGTYAPKTSISFDSKSLWIFQCTETFMITRVPRGRGKVRPVFWESFPCSDSSW